MIVDSDLHTQYDSFCKNELDQHFIYIELSELLTHYLDSKPGLQASTKQKYGIPYVLLQQSQMDDLCQWVIDLREQYLCEGNAVFKNFIAAKGKLTFAVYQN